LEEIFNLSKRKYMAKSIEYPKLDRYSLIPEETKIEIIG